MITRDSWKAGPGDSRTGTRWTGAQFRSSAWGRRLTVFAPEHSTVTLTDARVAPWLTLASGGATGTERPMSRSRLVVRVLALALVVAVIVTVAGGLVARSLAESLAVDSVRQRTAILGLDVAGPAIRDGLVTGDRADVARLDRRVREHVLSADIARVKVWTADGTIVYSDEPRLIGRTFHLGDEEQEALRHDGADAEISDLSKPENRYERGPGRLLEVYRVVHTPDGTPLLFEIYYPYDEVVTRMDRIWLTFAGISAASLLLLLIALVPLLRGLVRALERAREQRELLLQRALDASEAERRRIAAGLHDGPVQDLVGASYRLGAASLAVAGTEAARTIEEAELTTRGTVQILRAALVDIYPPSLAEAGLAEAIGDLAAIARSRNIPVRVRIDPDLQLAADVERLVFRVARETLANAVKHGGGAPVSVTVAAEPGRTVLTVSDDGPGFEPDALLSAPADAHFGLRLLRDAVADSGVAAQLDVRSAPGHGTTWRLTIPS
jgi:two-component system NarL family sensor kinase